MSGNTDVLMKTKIFFGKNLYMDIIFNYYRD